MSDRILFVCLGNICRSPAAEGVFGAMAPGAGFHIDSAGTSGWHLGQAPYAPMMDAAARRGIDLSRQTARQFTRRDFLDFDLIIGMDGDNIANIERLRPVGAETPVRLFTDFAPQAGIDHVPDPYYTRDFEGALDLIELCAAGLLRHLQ